MIFVRIVQTNVCMRESGVYGHCMECGRFAERELKLIYTFISTHPYFSETITYLFVDHSILKKSCGSRGKLNIGVEDIGGMTYFGTEWFEGGHFIHSPLGGCYTEGKIRYGVIARCLHLLVQRQNKVVSDWVGTVINIKALFAMTCLHDRESFPNPKFPFLITILYNGLSVADGVLP